MAKRIAEKASALAVYEAKANETNAQKLKAENAKKRVHYGSSTEDLAHMPAPTAPVYTGISGRGSRGRGGTFRGSRGSGLVFHNQNVRGQRTEGRGVFPRHSQSDMGSSPFRERFD